MKTEREEIHEAWFALLAGFKDHRKPVTMDDIRKVAEIIGLDLDECIARARRG